MAKIWDIDKDKSDFLVRLQKAIQSVNINFLIGSGCSHPALTPLENVENEIQKKLDESKPEEAEKMIFDFLKPFLEVSAKMESADSNINATLENYRTFLTNISEILFERKSNILSKQATVFSTNYDLFIEKAFEAIESPARLNDGFNRSPLLTSSFIFSPAEYFNSIYNNGNLYNYQVQIPSINLIKIHGSLTWQVREDKIVFSVGNSDALLKQHEEISASGTANAIEEFNDSFSLVLPKKEKFKECILNQTYYELLRIYANELDKENTVLIAEGFSFADEHILAITTRALKNPTLNLVIFCYQKEELENYKRVFSVFNNVDIVYSESEKITFSLFNSIMKEVLPLGYKPKVDQLQEDQR